MSERKNCNDLWGDYNFLAEQLRIHIYCYLTDIPETKGKIFRLNLAMNKDEFDTKIIGIKVFPDGSTQVHVKDIYGTEWFNLADESTSYPNSVSRMDLLMWICEEFDNNINDPSFWVEDESLLEVS